MPYDALGNYIPGDDPSIDQMQYELTKRGRPLDKVVNTFKEVINNPLGTAIKKGFEAREAVKDVGRIGASFSPAGIVPIWQAVADAGVSNVSKLGAEGLYNLTGDQANAARVAKERANLPTVPKLIEKYSAPLQAKTPGGQAIQQGVTKFLFDDLKLPMIPAGPRGSGFAASGERRPMLTPNDTRAILGETNRVATQVRDIPTDFQNAQSGFRRLDPITNKPTFGTKLQGAADSLGDTMQRRKEQGLNLVPGVPDEFVLDTQMYAVRPDNSMAIVPKVPPTVSTDRRIDPFDQQRISANNMLDSLDLGDKEQTTRQYTAQYLAAAPANVKKALKDFGDEDAKQMFPNIANIADVRESRDALYSDPVAKEKYYQDLLNRFAQTNPQFKLPTFDEHQQRVTAVQTMIQDQYVPWVAKHTGTPSDPQLLLAQQGKSVTPPESLFESASDNPIGNALRIQRNDAGFPTIGTSGQKVLELQAQLDQAKQVANASQQVYAEQQSAAGPGQSAHLMFPDFNENRAKKEKDAAVVVNLEQQIENNKIGMAYEDLADQMVTPFQAYSAKARIPRHLEQFYPKLMKQRDDQKVYQIGSGPLDTMALGKRVAQDVMSGKIPLDVVPKLTDFTKLAERYGTKEGKAYVARQQAAKNYVVNANTRLQNIVSQIPQEQRFDKLGAIFLDDNLSFEQIDKLTSDDTALLDHCIGEAGQTRNKSKLTDRTHGWVPMYDVSTGERNPQATRTHTRYAEKIVDGRYIVSSLRDTETGYPITTISWEPYGNTIWQTDFLSGFNNQEAIRPEYRDSVKKFLNSVSEGNGPLGLSEFKVGSASGLENMYKLYDKADSSSMSFARASLATQDKAALKSNPAILSQMPRFFSIDDLKQALTTSTSVPSASEPDNVRGLTQARNILLEELDSLRDTVPASELQTMMDDINHEIADIDARLVRARQQPAPQQAPTGITRGDVVRTLVETQLAINPDAVGLQDLVFSGTVDFDPNNPVQSLINVREYLAQHVVDSWRSPEGTIDALNAVVSNGMIPRLNELIAELSPAQQQAPAAPVAPVPQTLTRDQQIAIARAPQIADMIIGNEGLETPQDLRNMAMRLYDRREGQDTARELFAIGDTLGDFEIRASDYRLSHLVQVGHVLHERADALERGQGNNHPYGFTPLVLNDIRDDIISAFQVGDGGDLMWRREVMPIVRDNWDSDFPSSSIQAMISDLEMHMRMVNPALQQGEIPDDFVDNEAYMDHYAGLRDLREGLDNILTSVQELERDFETSDPEVRMAQISMAQADGMSYAELAAAVPDPAQYDSITARLVREIRLNDREPGEVVQRIIDGGRVGNLNLFDFMPVERELIARDVTDTIRALSAARAAPRNTLRQDMVSAYVTSLQHPDESVNNALQNIRNVMDTLTIDMQGRGETPVAIGGELLNDISERIRNVQSLVDRRETITNLTMQGTDAVLNGLIEARQNVAEAMIRHAEQEAAQAREQQQQAEPQAQIPDIGDFIQMLRRTDGIQVAERVETVVFRTAENTNPNREIRQFANALREAAENEENELVDNRLNELADEFEAADVRRQVAEFEPEDQQGPSQYVQSIQPTINNLANELLYDDTSPEGVQNVPEIESTIFALRNGTFDHAAFRAMPEAERQNAMNAVADDIDGRLVRNTPPAVDDDMPIMTNDYAGLVIDDELSTIIRVYGQDVGERTGRVVEDILEHLSFEDDPYEIINRLRRHTATGYGVSLSVRGNVEQSLQDIAQRLEELYETELAVREIDARRAQQPPAEPQPQQMVAQTRSIPQNIRGMSINEMTAQLPGPRAHSVITLAAQITDVNTPDEIRNIVGLVRQYAIGGWEYFMPMQREYLARYLERYVEEPQQFVAQPAQPAQQLIITDEDANEAQDAVDFFSDALEEIVDDSGRPAAIREIDRALEELNDGEDEIYGLWQGEELTPGIREALRNRLLYLRREYLDEPPQEYAKGGRVQQIPSTDQMQYELIMRRA